MSVKTEAEGRQNKHTNRSGHNPSLLRFSLSNTVGLHLIRHD